MRGERAGALLITPYSFEREWCDGSICRNGSGTRRNAGATRRDGAAAVQPASDADARRAARAGVLGPSIFGVRGALGRSTRAPAQGRTGRDDQAAFAAGCQPVTRVARSICDASRATEKWRPIWREDALR